jgi:nucleotide-binding universal stress UspA family protein
MSFKSLLVHALPGDASRLRTEAATALAIRLDALLIGLGAEAIPPIATSDPYGFGTGQWTPLLYEQQTRNLEAAKTAFAAQSEGARTEWRSVGDLPTPAMARVARAVDLVVTGGPAGTGDIYNTVSTPELLISSGRPMLVVPPHGGRLDTRRVMVAWKDTREARRAVSDALSFMHMADEILIVALGAREDQDALSAQANDVAGMIARHSMAKPRTHVAVSGGDDVQTDLLAQADRMDADLIVSGAYGHSRAYEWVLGGVTRHLLHACERFVFLSH